MGELLVGGGGLYKKPSPKCRLYWCIEFIDWRYSKSCCYFRSLLGTSAHLTFSLVHLPPSPLRCVNKYTGVTRWEEVIGLCGEYIQELCTVHLTRFRTYKITLSPQNKNLGGEGASER